MRRARRMTRSRSSWASGYPGGPPVDKLAHEGNNQAIDLPRTRLTHADRNPPPPDLASPFPPGLKHIAEFSFSGLKTAVVRYLRERGVAVATGLAVPSDAGPLSPKEVADVCASFQRVVVEALVDRTFAAAAWLGARSIGIAGGVSANSRLRHDALARGEREGIAGVRPVDQAVDRQRRDDRGRSAPQARARRVIAAGLQRSGVIGNQ